MRIEFDPAKDVVNLAKHGISLQAAAGFDWDTAIETEDDRFDYGELRFVALGFIGESLYAMVFTEGSDDDSIRVISLRLAEKRERRDYFDQI